MKDKRICVRAAENNTMNKNNDDQFPSFYVYILGLFPIAVALLMVFTWPFIANSLGVSEQTGFLPFLRSFMIVFFLIVLLPGSFMIELFYSRWRRRRFYIRNVLVGCGIIGEGILAMVVVSFAFQFAYPNLSFSHEPFPGLAGLALGLTAVVPTATVVLTSRIPKVLEYLKKIYE